MSFKIMVSLTVIAGSAMADPLEDLGALCDRPLRIAVRAEAAPFSFRRDLLRSDSAPRICGVAPEGRLPEHAGFTVEICRRFADAVARACGPDSPAARVETIELAVADRSAALVASVPDFDLLCGSTTATVSLAGEAPTSPYIFVTGTSPLASERFLGGKSCRIGVVGGTTSDQGSERHGDAWAAFVERNPACEGKSRADTAFEVYDTYAEAVLDIGAAEGARADVLVGDRHILEWYRSMLPLLADGPGDEKGRAARHRLRTLDNILSVEPYAVVAPLGRGRVMAHFSRFLVDLQSGRDFDALVGECFGLGVDRSLWRLLDFQKNVRIGDLLPRSGQ